MRARPEHPLRRGVRWFRTLLEAMLPMSGAEKRPAEGEGTAARSAGSRDEDENGSRSPGKPQEKETAGSRR